MSSLSLSTGKEEKKSGYDDHAYYNISVTNPTTATDVKLCNFSETRNAPLLETPGDYHLSIIRASVPAEAIPLFLFKQGAYKVALRMSFPDYGGGNDFETYVDYPDTRPDLDLGIYAYDDMIFAINAALRATYLNVQAANPGLFPDNHAPQLQLDGATQLISLYADPTIFLPPVPASGPIYICFNAALFSFFNNFNVHTTRALNPFCINPAYSHDYFVIKPDTTATEVTIFAFGTPVVAGDARVAYTAMKMTQPYSTLYLWSDVRSIVFTSSICIKPEMLTAPTATSENNMRKILVDFLPAFDTGTNGRSTYAYNPTILRFLDLMGSTPLNYIDLTVSWEDNNGVLHPIKILPGDSLNVKLQFTRKGVVAL